MLEPSPGNKPTVDAFTQLICGAYDLRDKRRFSQAEQEFLARRREARGASHTGDQTGAIPVDGIMESEPNQALGTVSKTVGTRKGLRCESSVLRKQKKPRRAS